MAELADIRNGWRTVYRRLQYRGAVHRYYSSPHKSWKTYLLQNVVKMIIIIKLLTRSANNH